MSSISFPRGSFTIVGDTTQALAGEHIVLAVGQKTTGSAVSGELIESIGNAQDENALFGENSVLASMIRNYKLVNKQTRIDAIALDDNVGATAATGGLAFIGSAPTANGTLTVVVGSKRENTYTVNIASGDTPTIIGDNLVTAITADTKAVVTPINTAGVVDFTAVNSGLIGNDISIFFDTAVPGMVVAINNMGGGLLNPDLSTVFDVVGDQRYQSIIWQSAFTTVELTDFLDARFNSVDAILQGVGFQGVLEAFGSLVPVGAAQNSASLSFIPNNLISDSNKEGGAILEASSSLASQYVGIRALRLTEGTNLSDLVIDAGTSLDSRGGVAISSLPYANTPFPNLPIIPVDEAFTNAEMDDLRDAGFTVIGNNGRRNLIISSDAVTTYKRDAFGEDDVSFKFLNFVDTSSAINEQYFVRLKRDYAQSRLSDGEIIPDRKIATEESIRANCLGIYSTLSTQDFVLTRAGQDNVDFYDDNLTVDLVIATGTVNITQRVPIVSQIRELNVLTQIVFDIN